ncbi:MAG: GNAT family N-acetyltransferase [Thermotogae bacterium]|nr:GNAT family N-acetyltransferase [Thermotogota bacterium]
MVDFRCVRPNELTQVFDVINQVFRSRYDPTMQLEFPLLFSTENLQRVFIALEKGKVVSHMGYQKAEYIDQNRRLSVAFLGAVATLPEHRGTGIASRLLEMAEEAMRAEMIDLCLISGNRSLYLRHGYSERGATYEYLLTIPDTAPNVSVRAYSERDIDVVLAIYAQEEKRFHRDAEAFRKLLGVYQALKGQGPRSIPIAQIGPTYLVYDHDIPVAYFNLRGNQKYPIEYAGDRESVLRGLQRLAKETGHPFYVWVPESDAAFLTLLERKEPVINNRYRFPPSHTSKILNETALEDSLLLGMPLPGLNYV